MDSQRDHWNKIWKNYHSNNSPSAFFIKTMKKISLPRKALVVELTCGQGNETHEFLKLGYNVVAVDFSTEIILRVNNTLRSFIESKRLKLIELDLNIDFPQLKENSVDLVYCHLGLHYFSTNRMREIYKKIHKILKIDGWIAFAVKTINDPLYGKGSLIEYPHMYMYHNHMRQFYSEDILYSYLNDFQIKYLKEVKEPQTSSYRNVFHCIAQPK